MLLCPEKLVSCRIKHKVQETEDNRPIPEWFDSTVIKIEEINTKFPSKTLFEVQHDVDGEGVSYDFPLLAELKKGNLIIMWPLLSVFIWKQFEFILSAL